MSRIVRMSTSLPSGAPDARIWMTTDWILVRVGERTCCAHRKWMGQAELADLAGALTEAAGVGAS
jgi:hypothetical protein